MLKKLRELLDYDRKLKNAVMKSIKDIGRRRSVEIDGHGLHGLASRIPNFSYTEGQLITSDYTIHRKRAEYCHDIFSSPGSISTTSICVFGNCRAIYSAIVNAPPPSSSTVRGLAAIVVSTIRRVYQNGKSFAPSRYTPDCTPVGPVTRPRICLPLFV